MYLRQIVVWRQVVLSNKNPAKWRDFYCPSIAIFSDRIIMCRMLNETFIFLYVNCWRIAA